MGGLEAQKFGLEEVPDVRLRVIFLETQNATARKRVECRLDYMPWSTCDEDMEWETLVLS
jgi:hypothetical protein